MVYNRLAEFTEPDMFITAERVGLMPQMGALRTQRHIVVYKVRIVSALSLSSSSVSTAQERDMSRRPGLNFDAIVHREFYLIIGITALFIKLIASACKRITRKPGQH